MPSISNRLRCLAAVLLLPLLLGAQKHHAEAPVACQDGFVKVESNEEIPASDCKAIIGKFKKAWDFDLEQMKWPASRELSRPLTLLVKPDSEVKARASANMNGDRVIIRRSIADDDEGALRTLAHELGHIQSARIMGRHATQQVARHYFMEGHGQMLNRLIALRIGKYNEKPFATQAKNIMSMTADEARSIFSDDTYGEGTKDLRKSIKMEVLGLYFLDYLQTRYHGKGFPDTLPRVAQVFENIGHGESYEQAFKHAFGVSPESVQTEIVDLFQKTEANPEQRLAQTFYETHH
jgi:hypothetical protein